MECAIEKRSDVIIVKLTGRLDTNSADDFGRECSRLIAEGEKRLFFDFEGLDFVGSTGLRVILATAKEAQRNDGEVALYNLKEIVKEVFDISGFTSILSLYDSLEDALAGGKGKAGIRPQAPNT